MRIASAVLLAALVASGGAQAQSWATTQTEKTGFAAPVALFVKDRATGYGMYVPRVSNHFKPGEALLFYVEPAGYAYKVDGGLYRFGARMDLRLSQDGKVVFSKDGFLNADFTSHHQNKEINFSGSLDIEGAPSGAYQMELLMTDSYGGGTAKVVLPFVVD